MCVRVQHIHLDFHPSRETFQGADFYLKLKTFYYILLKWQCLLLQASVAPVPVVATPLNVRFGGSHGKDTYRDILRRSRSQSLYTSNIVSSNQQKSSFAHAENFFCTFPCRCFARLQRETSRNFTATRFMEDLLYGFLFTFICTAAHFHLGCRQYFSFSHCFQHCENTGKNKSHQQISSG